MLNIFDLNGRLILTESVGRTVQLNTSNMVKGMYVLQVIAAERIVTQRFVVD